MGYFFVGPIKIVLLNNKISVESNIILQIAVWKLVFSSRAASSSELSWHCFSVALAPSDDGDDDTGDDFDDEDIPASRQSSVQMLWGEGDILSGYHETLDQIRWGGVLLANILTPIAYNRMPLP